MDEIKRYLPLIVFYMTVLMAGTVYAAQPPKQLMKAVIYAREGSTPQQSERYGAMSDFIKCLTDRGNSVSWEQTSKTWILHTKKQDTLTKETTKVSWEFVYDKKHPEIIALNRVLAGGVVLNDSLSVMDNFQSCWEQPTWDSKNNILRAINEAKTIYSDGGIAGIKAEITNCYDNANTYNPKSNLKLMLLERCLGIDVTGHLVDSGASTTMNFPADPFLTQKALQERTGVFLEYYPEEDLNNILSGVIGFASQNL